MPGWNFGKCNCCDGGDDGDIGDGTPCPDCDAPQRVYTVNITSAIKLCSPIFGGFFGYISTDLVVNKTWTVTQVPGLCRWISEPERHSVSRRRNSNCTGALLDRQYGDAYCVIEFDRNIANMGIIAVPEGSPSPATSTNITFNYLGRYNLEYPGDCNWLCNIQPFSTVFFDCTNALIQIENCVEGI